VVKQLPNQPGVLGRQPARQGFKQRESARGLTIKNNIMNSVYRISSLNGRCVSNGTLDANALFRNY
jgi:ribosomal protein S6E (S10)